MLQKPLIGAPQRLAGSMIATVLVVAALAYWDEERESAAMLEDFGQEQATLAASAAAELGARLGQIRMEASRVAGLEPARLSPGGSLLGYVDATVVDGAQPAGTTPLGRNIALDLPLAELKTMHLVISASDLFAGLARLERANALALFIVPPGGTLRAVDGREVKVPELDGAIASGRSTVRLAGPVAAGLGLPDRTALAGLASASAGPLGTWSVAVVASAERPRDRERRARARLVLAVALATGLVVGFGGVAIRKQRKEMQLERELAVAELARQGDERLERFSRAATTVTLASGVAHEISTPLGVILGRAEQLLERVDGDERARRAARTIMEQAERIKDVIRGFLDLARGGTPTLQEVAPEAVVREALAMVEHRFEKAGVLVVSHVEAGLPLLRCDPRLFEHALVNLLLNACDASRPGAAVAVGVSQASGAITFAVDDEGEGITAAQASRVGEPFFTTKPRGKGTGLGLAIVGEIAKIHHGSLRLAPREAGGTRASIQVPIPEAAEVERA